MNLMLTRISRFTSWVAQYMVCCPPNAFDKRTSADVALGFDQ